MLVPELVEMVFNNVEKKEGSRLEKNPYKVLLIQNLEGAVLSMSRKQMKQCSVFSNEVKYVQYSQHPTGHYALEVKAPRKRYDTKMYTRLQVAERDVREMDFNPHPEKLRQDYVD